MKYMQLVSALGLVGAQAEEINRMDIGTTRSQAPLFFGAASRDTSFKLDEGNNSFIYMDLFKALSQEDPRARRLRNKVRNYKKQRKHAGRQKFGAAAKRLGLNDSVPQTNYQNQLYWGSIFMGDSDQEQKVIFDTSSDWLTVESSACFTCEGNVYDFNTSASYSSTTVVPVDRYYGYTHLRGIEATDKVCLTSFSNCINPFTFFLVTDQFGLSPEIDGVLGLTLGGRMADTPTDFKVGPLFLEKLYEEGNITQKAFSTHFSTLEGQSFVDFGPPKD